MSSWRLSRTSGALVVCAGLVASCGGGESADTSATASCAPVSIASSTTVTLESVVDGVVGEQLKSLGLPGVAVSVAKQGTLLYSKGYGYTSTSSCAPVAADTEFQIGSVTKQFTAAAILQLQSSGLIDLDSPVLGYLPAYSLDSRITVRMLLNQTSGLDDYVNFPEASSWTAGVSEETALSVIAGKPLLFTPGSAYSYSNSNYYVLGSLIEAVTSIAYSSYLSADVFPAAGISHTSYTQPGNSASAYTAQLTSATIADPSFEFSAGALWSNVNDLATWDGALFKGQVVPAASFSLMTTPPPVNAYQQNVASNYGMGWARGMASGHPFIWHDGMTFGYSALNGVFLDDGFSVTLLTNLAVGGDQMENFAATLIHAICTTPETAGNC